MLLIIFVLIGIHLQNFGIEGEEILVQKGSAIFNSNWNEILQQAEAAEVEENDEEAIELYKELANNYETRKKYNQALPITWKLYKLQQKILGEEDDKTIQTVAQLGRIYYSKGKLEKAKDFLKRAYRLTKLKKGQNHRDTINILFNLAYVHRESRDPEDVKLALRYYRKVHDVRSKDANFFGEEHEETVQVLQHIGHVLSLLSRPAEAADILQDVLKIRSKTLGATHRSTFEAKKLLYNALSSAGKIGQAKNILGKSIKDRIDDESSFRTLVEGKARALAAEGKYDKALEMLIQLYEFEILKHHMSYNILLIVDRIVLYSQEHGDLDQIVKWAHVMIDLIQGQGQKVKVGSFKVNSEKEAERMIIFHLQALDALVQVYIQKNDEQKIEESLNEAVKITRGREESHSIYVRLSSIIIQVAKYTEKIGDMEAALRLHEHVAQNPYGHQSALSAINSLTSIDSMIRIAYTKDDYQLVADIALKFFPKTEQQNESENKLRLRASVARNLLNKAKEDFKQDNYDQAHALYKVFEEIWPKSWTSDLDDQRLTLIFESIGLSALHLNKIEEGIFYLGKAMDNLKNKLATDVTLDDEKRREIFKASENLNSIREDFGDFYVDSNPEEKGKSEL